MSLILSLVLIIIIIILYMLMIQIFTVLFRITGLTKEKARFQVISLLTNSGFSTSESELIMNHNTRRKVAKITMIIGNIFNVLIVSLLINILFNIKLDNEAESIKLLIIAIVCFVVILIVVRLPICRRTTERLIEKVATKINNKKHKENVITELDKYGNNAIIEVSLSLIPRILENKNIEESKLKSKYNINILLIQRNQRVIDVKRDTIVEVGDRLVLFGKESVIRDIFEDVENKNLIDESKKNNISLVENYSSNAVVEIEIKELPNILIDKTLSESTLKEEYDINVIMIYHDKHVILAKADSKIEIGDKVMLFGPYDNIKQLFGNEFTTQGE